MSRQPFDEPEVFSDEIAKRMREAISVGYSANQNMPMPRFMTTDEVADVCRTSPATVRYWRHIGTGPKHFKLGRRVLYAVEDIEQWIDQARKRAWGSS